MYFDIIRRLEVMPCCTPCEYDRLGVIADELSQRVDLNPDEKTVLATILIFMEQFRHHSLLDKEGSEVLLCLMKDRGLNQSELASATGIPQGRISEILAGQRSISRGNAAILGEYFDVPPYCFDPRVSN